MVDAKVRHISFATADFSDAARLLRASARRHGIETFIYTDHHPVVAQLRRANPVTMSGARGAGHWLWKPAIIRDAMARSADGTIILYTDVAMQFVAAPNTMLTCALMHPVVLFEHVNAAAGAADRLMRYWTKRDCFVLLDADLPEFWDLQQLWAGLQVYRNGPESRRFVDALLAACRDPRILTDMPNTKGPPDLPGFVAHRHDQAVLTIIAHRLGAYLLPDPTQWGGPANAARPFHLHRRRDRGPFSRLRGRMFGVATGRWAETDITLEPPAAN